MKTKYRTMRCAAINYKYLQIIQERYYPTMSTASIGNEFLNRYIKEHFSDEVSAVDMVVEGEK